MLRDFVRYPSVTSDTNLQCFYYGCTQPYGRCSSQCHGSGITKLRAVPIFWITKRLTPASMLAQVFFSVSQACTGCLALSVLILTEGWGPGAIGFIGSLALIGRTLLGQSLLSVYDWLLRLLGSFVLVQSINLVLPSSFVGVLFCFLNVFVALSYLRVSNGGHVVVAFFDSQDTFGLILPKVM